MSKKFKLDNDFVNSYQDRKVPFGPLGEITFLRTYSRLKSDGSRETWQDVCRRVVEWVFSVLQDHHQRQHLPWDELKMHQKAAAMFDSLFYMRFTPPGRGLFAAGATISDHHSGALQNCSFISTGDYDDGHPSQPYTLAMSQLMLGVGVGFDNGAAARNQDVFQPVGDSIEFRIPDTREGWCQALGLLLDSYLLRSSRPVAFNYDDIRPKGAPISTMGGTASGPEPLRQLLEQVRTLLTAQVGSKMDTVIIADICNLIGRCVVSGNVRRSAEIFLAGAGDLALPHLKNPAVFPGRQDWSWASNNSIVITDDDDLESIFTDELVDRLVENGEPGFIFIDNARNFGRFGDGEGYIEEPRIQGCNPCGEMMLESGECCTLAEVFISNCASLDEFIAACSAAHTYCKAVTLKPTPWKKTNQVMQRNRRIGIGLSGVTDFADARSLDELVEWAGLGYSFLENQDHNMSEALGIRESVKLSTIKPSGTISLLAGASPGCHFTPGGEFYLRAIRFSNLDPVLPVVLEAGYHHEPDVYTADTTVVFIPVQSSSTRSERDVPIEGKLAIAEILQSAWADNGVSLTLSFDAETERDKLKDILFDAEESLKGVSFLAMETHTFRQPPYQTISAEEYEIHTRGLKPLDLARCYEAGFGAAEPEQERGCETDVCELKALKTQG